MRCHEILNFMVFFKEKVGDILASKIGMPSSAIRVLMCYPSEEAPASTDGDTYVAYKGKRWDVVPYDEVFDSNGNPVHSDATYLCLDGTLGVQKLPMFEFTQVGLVDSPQLASNATSAHEASATEVIDWGSLYFYENRVKESYTDTMTKTIRYMIKF